MNRVLMRSIADLAVFLAEVEDEFVDADAALRALESLAAALHELRDDERTEFTEFVAGPLVEEAERSGDQRRAAALRDLPVHLGIR